MIVGPLIALFLIAVVSLLLVRVGATALMMTGLSWDIAISKPIPHSSESGSPPAKPSTW